jgi:hypothetical protein
MHDALRRRVLRRLETLPEAQLYQILDYIEFLESRYNRGQVTDATGLQKLAEKLEDGLRKRTVNPSNLREAFQLIAAADRVLSSVSEAGKEILTELQAELQAPPGQGAGRGIEPEPYDPARESAPASSRTQPEEPSGEAPERG